VRWRSLHGHSLLRTNKVIYHVVRSTPLPETNNALCTSPTNESRLPTTRRNYLARRDSRRVSFVLIVFIVSLALRGFPPRWQMDFPRGECDRDHVALRVETHARSSANRAAAEARRAHSIFPGGGHHLVQIERARRRNSSSACAIRLSARLAAKRRRRRQK